MSTWLPELPHAGRLTPRLLLAHRSGLREYGRDRALARRLTGGAPDHPWTRGEVIDAIARRAPGAVVAGHDGLYFGWTASTSIDDATATTIAVVTNLAGPRIPALRVAEAARAALS